jgi:hypothetical protein
VAYVKLSLTSLQLLIYSLKSFNESLIMKGNKSDWKEEGVLRYDGVGGLEQLQYSVCKLRSPQIKYEEKLRSFRDCVVRMSKRTLKTIPYSV